ncbi:MULTISPECIES: hypothetical protein [Providencia]|uniref:hypothetical protein n=1 Tax=Providencia TaxID=586 RepID=UPI0024ABD4E4|nr:hypothetical protein [Providencia sp. CIM-Carb-044]MCK9791192.1 hypothetical protein [Providencia rettgeri]MDX7425915.1 hypothetical protein [Providencia sp. CIM-Carb-044]
MAFNTFNTKSQQHYYSPDLVQSYFVFHSLIDHLKNQGKSWRFDRRGYNEVETLNKEINEIRVEYSLDNEVSNFKSLFKKIKNSLIDENLNWIKNDLRSALYLWFQWGYGDSESDKLFFEELESTPSDVNEVINNICNDFFLNYKKMDILKKRIQGLHAKWQYLSRKKRLSWLDVNDPHQSKWAYKYLCDKDKVFRSRFICDPINQGIVVQVYYDINHNNNGIKFIFHEMNNAWNQYKYRKNNADKKVLSGYISQDAKMKLTEMAKKARMPEYELIELLILEYYDTEKK